MSQAKTAGQLILDGDIISVGQPLFYVHSFLGMYAGCITGFHTNDSGDDIIECCYSDKECRMPPEVFAYNYGKTWFTDEAKAEARHKEIRVFGPPTTATHRVVHKPFPKNKKGDHDTELAGLVAELLTLNDENLAKRVIETNDVQNALIALEKMLKEGNTNGQADCN